MVKSVKDSAEIPDVLKKKNDKTDFCQNKTKLSATLWIFIGTAFKTDRSLLKLSPYMDLYDIVVAEDHELRKIKKLVDFSFVDRWRLCLYT